MKRIMLFSGKAESGKDLFASKIKEVLEENGQRVLIIRYADYLKFLCREYFGWDGVKDDNGRSILQRVGTDVVREIKPNFWVDSVIQFIELFEHEFDFFLIPDTRFPNEIDAMIDRFGYAVMPLYVHRINPDGTAFENSLSPEQRNHRSETALDGCKEYIYSFLNSKQELIEDKVKSFLYAFNLLKI